jgi:hypothetical protein
LALARRFGHVNSPQSAANPEKASTLIVPDQTTALDDEQQRELA